MDFTYTPHRDAGGTLHFPSPTHPLAYGIDNLSTLHKLRRSMSKSPSKPQRYHIYSPHAPTGHSKSSLSLGLANLASPSFIDASETWLTPGSHFDRQQLSTTKKARFPVKRTSSLRNLSRTRSTPSSPMRRALVDTNNQGNCLPSSARGHSGTVETFEKLSKTDIKGQPHRLSLNDGPIKFDFARNFLENTAPVKSSPLKRSDGLLDVDANENCGSPVAKRRSLHAGDFDMAKYALSVDGSGDDRRKSTDNATQNALGGLDSPSRRAHSLRKSTLQQRQSPAQPKSSAPEFLVPATTIPRSRQRFSLDGSVPSDVEVASTPPKRSLGNTGTPFTSHHNNMPLRPSPSTKQPHPLANALSQSSSASSFGDSPSCISETPFRQSVRFEAQPSKPVDFSKSLPLGAIRPHMQRLQTRPPLNCGEITDPSPFSTPALQKHAKPLPPAFMSTGLISKKNRNAEIPPGDPSIHYIMPDTPSKRVSFPPMTATPFRKSTFDSPAGDINHETSPGSPFGVHHRIGSRSSFGQSVSLFGSRMKASSMARKASFASLTGEDDGQSPSQIVESQSSNDEFPPTPTKNGDGRRSKENSLRSSLFGRRTSMTADTFLPPQPTIEDPDQPSRQVSPHTPQESFTPPDPSTLSISGKGAPPEQFRFSTNSNTSFPPATPTASRDYQFPFNELKTGSVAGVFHNDIDTAITARFGVVAVYGSGEFSQVYRVEQPIRSSYSDLGNSFSNLGKVWAVKRTKRPYLGVKDKDRKLQEVRILRKLRGHEHIVQWTDSWEDKGHLYIQTEFCENGNLKDFLTQTGFKARLDDFRIWKILLELSSGLKHIHDNNFIHLDLKPANVFIDWEGVLKIGDFGLASQWPAPRHIDGEGDREYIAPEILRGRFDKPADVFSLGMIMLEIAGNILLPDNGTSWQRLRAGDMSELPSLTWTESGLSRDELGDPIESRPNNRSNESLMDGPSESGSYKFQREGSPTPGRREVLALPPTFMTDAAHPEALDKVVQWMICPEPTKRPSVTELSQLGPVLWVERRRRAGATVYEGNYGPAEEVLNHNNQDVDMTDA